MGIIAQVRKGDKGATHLQSGALNLMRVCKEAARQTSEVLFHSLT